MGLPQEVTRLEIQEAYRRLCRKIHPDGKLDNTSDKMARINKAYKMLMHFADNYTLKLTKSEEGMTGEEWWFHHFGQDPLWAGDKEAE